MNTTLESLLINLSLQKRQIKNDFENTNEAIDDLKKQIDALKLMGGGSNSGGGGVDINVLNSMFARKDAPDNTIKRIEALEEKLQQAAEKYDSVLGIGETSDVKDLAGRVAKLEQRADKTDESVKSHDGRIKWCEDELAKLKASFEGMGQGNGDTSNVDTNAIMMRINMLSEEMKHKLSKQDLDKLRIELKEYTDKEAREVEKKLDSSIDGLRYEIERLRADFETFKSKDFNDLVNRVAALEKKVANLAGNMNTRAPEPVSSIDDRAFQELCERVADLANDLNNLRNEFAAWMKKMQDGLNQKTDIDYVNNMENKITEKISDIIRALSKNFADRNETKKALKQLERQLKNLYDLFMSKGGHENEEDAMFSKKPLGGLSCASCEKDLVNMYGKRVEFMPWSKLPVRDPAERIARVG